MSGEQEVHPAVRLERPQVQVVVQLADDVDADHVAERLDDPQIRVRAVDDAPRVAEPGARERERRLGLPHAGRAVEEEGVRVPAGERGGQQPLGLGLLRKCRRRAPIDLLGEQLGARGSVDDHEPVRLALCELPVSAGCAGVEVVFLALDPVALAAHAADGVVGADLEQDRAVGHQPLDGGEVELEHPLEAEAAGDALVGDRRVDVAVADHGGAARERRPDQLLDVLGTRGRVERRLGPRSDVAAVEDEVADLLAERRAAGLAREDDLDRPRPRAARRAGAPAWSCRSRRAPRR